MASLPVTKQAFTTIIGGVLSAGLAGVSLFDPSVHLPANAHGYVACVAAAMGSALAGVFVSSSHKKEATVQSAAHQATADVAIYSRSNSPNQ